MDYYNHNINDGDDVIYVGDNDRIPLEKGKTYTVETISKNKAVLLLKGFGMNYFVNKDFEKSLTEREQALKEVINMYKDKVEFYKKEMETQVKIVFEVSRERNELKKELQKWKDECGHPIGMVHRKEGKLVCNRCDKLIK